MPNFSGLCVNCSHPIVKMNVFLAASPCSIRTSYLCFFMGKDYNMLRFCGYYRDTFHSLWKPFYTFPDSSKPEEHSLVLLQHPLAVLLASFSLWFVNTGCGVLLFLVQCLCEVMGRTKPLHSVLIRLPSRGNLPSRLIGSHQVKDACLLV